jgi:hypothetical protein
MLNPRRVAAVLISVSAPLLLTSCEYLQPFMSETKCPPYLEKAGVHTQTLPLKKEQLVASGKFGDVTDICVNGDSIVLAGTESGAYLTREGAIQSAIKYDNPVSDVSLIPPHKDSDRFRFLSRGGWTTPPCLFDANGKTIWKGKDKSGVDDTAYGVLPDNLLGRFVVGYNGGDGVSLLDEGGKELWTQPDGNVWHVEITSPKNLADARIVHSNASGVLTIRDGQGKVLKRKNLPFYFSHFSLCRYPQRADDQYVLSVEDGKLWLVNLKTGGVTDRKLPVNYRFADSHATLVRLKAGEPDYLAAIIAWTHIQRSMLCVFDSSGKLVYEEVLPEICKSIQVMPTVAKLDADGKSTPAEKSAPEVLLVGGSGKVWRYQ